MKDRIFGIIYTLLIIFLVCGVIFVESLNDENRSFCKVGLVYLDNYLYNVGLKKQTFILNLSGGRRSISMSEIPKKTFYDGLYYNSGTKRWEYYKNGKPDYIYNGFATNSNGTYYVEKGIVTFNRTGLMFYNKKWVAVINSKVSNSYTGILSNSNGTYLVENGTISFKYNGAYKDKIGNVYILKNSKLNVDFNGLKYVNDTWYYFRNGKTDLKYNGFATNSNGTYYVEKGIVTFKSTGLMFYNKKWVAVINSKINNSYTGILSNSNGTYLVENGTISFKYNGTYKDKNSKVYKINNSKVIWIWPTNSPYVITSEYGYRWGTFHDGLDISGTGKGSPIYATLGGKVYQARWGGIVGNLSGLNVVIEHPNGYYTIYAHCSKVYVEAGDTVVLGQKIAEMGDTGFATGPHLHFGVFKGLPYNGGKSINPRFLWQ